MATVFVDMIGFFVVLPLLPFYAEKLGADPLRVGALISTFALAQLVTAPLWGRLSDHYGRRPMILLGLLISAGAYAIFELATAVWLLFLSRFVQGAGSGTTGVVLAYVSDSVGKEERAKSLGWLTAATSAGVMLGPAIGSLSASLGWIGPGFLAAGLCLLNFAFGWLWLPEPANGGEEGSRERRAERGATRRTIAEFVVRPRGPVASLVWIYTLGMMAFMAMNGVFALYLERVFGVTEATIGWFFVYVGGISLIMRSLILGRVLARGDGALRRGHPAAGAGGAADSRGNGPPLSGDDLDDFAPGGGVGDRSGSRGSAGVRRGGADDRTHLGRSGVSACWNPDSLLVGCRGDGSGASLCREDRRGAAGSDPGRRGSTPAPARGLRVGSTIRERR
jgi:MFS family permease